MGRTDRKLERLTAGSDSGGKIKRAKRTEWQLKSSVGDALAGSELMKNVDGWSLNRKFARMERRVKWGEMQVLKKKKNRGKLG